MNPLASTAPSALTCPRDTDPACMCMCVCLSMYRTTSTCRMQAILRWCWLCWCGADGTHCPPWAHDFTSTPRDRLTHHPINASLVTQDRRSRTMLHKEPFFAHQQLADGGGFEAVVLPTAVQEREQHVSRYCLSTCLLLADRLNIFRWAPSFPRLALGSRQRHAARLHTAIPSSCGRGSSSCWVPRAGWLGGHVRLAASSSPRLSLLVSRPSISCTHVGQKNLAATGAGKGDNNDGHMLDRS